MFAQKSSSALRDIRRWRARAAVVVARRDVVKDHAARGEEAAVSGPSQAEGEVDVFVIGAVERVEASQAFEDLGAIERTRAAGAEDFFDGTAGEEPGGLAVPSLGWPAGEAVGIAGGVDATAAASGPRTRGATDPTDGIRERCEAGFDPAAVTSVSLLSNWMNWPRAAAMPALAAAQKPPFARERTDADTRDRPLPATPRCRRSTRRR